MSEYEAGREQVERTAGRRENDHAHPVVIEGATNGAKDDLDRLLELLSDICDRASHAAKWMRRIGWFVLVGVIGALLTAGAWYFKVDKHVDKYEPATDRNTELANRTAIVLDGIEGRVTRLEEHEDQQE